MAGLSLSRRQFTAAGLAVCGAKLFAQPLIEATSVTRLPAWSPGELDIHHIDTGRGNATFLLGPDGTTVLIDCGSSIDGEEVSAPTRPNASREPGDWVARYALRSAQAANRTTLDYLVATHIHPDHVGDVQPLQTPAVGEKFIRTGVSQVDHLMPAKVVIDRSYPDYGLLKPLRQFLRATI
jgi:glyoxylase-like metal-dependent hydrolase (beta-lactamase superfamily II)